MTIRVFAAIGPGDVVAAYDDWCQGVRTMSETSITFSSQEFDAFSEVRARFWAVSSFSIPGFREDRENRIENRPRGRGRSLRGWRFHVAQIAYALSLMRSAIAFRATHVVIDSGTSHWFLFAPLRLLGMALIPNLHNVLWNEGFRDLRWRSRIVRSLDSAFFRYCVRDAIGVSPECVRQLSVLSGGRVRLHDYRAQFEMEDFSSIARPPPVDRRPMHVLFAGRVERNKGVFDLVEIGSRLRETGQDVVIHVCGVGSASAELESEVRARHLSDRIVLHGKLARPQLLIQYGLASIVIVPTRSDFCEGLPMVCAEAVLAGRPVLTSRLSNALEALEGAAVEAKLDDPEDYARQVVALLDDPGRMSDLSAAARRVATQFVDRSRGLTALLVAILRQPSTNEDARG